MCFHACSLRVVVVKGYQHEDGLVVFFLHTCTHMSENIIIDSFVVYQTICSYSVGRIDILQQYLVYAYIQAQDEDSNLAVSD